MILRSYIQIVLFVLIATVVVQFAPAAPSSSGPEASGSEDGFDPPVRKSEGELVKRDAEKSAGGFTLFPISGTEEVLLLNELGQAVHKWNVDVDRARLLPNCNLLVVHGSKWGASRSPWEEIRPNVREYDWAGNVVWEYVAPDVVHHDVQRLADGNTIFLYKYRFRHDFRDVSSPTGFRNLRVDSDSIREVTSDGKLAWEWHTHEHLDVNECGRRTCKVDLSRREAQKRMVDWTHMNTVSVLPDNHWYRNGDKRFKPGNVMILPRNWWEVILIDRESKEVVWRYGGNYKGGLVRGHEAHMIPEGLPGAGNILIFDNGMESRRKESILLEIEPPTKKIVWKYEDSDTQRFFNRAAGSLQRLSNGNTFVSQCVSGRAFEITPAGEIVWEYQSNNRISRAHRYQPGYCAKLSELDPG